ncbi:MAG: DUF1801 domain-containing protein [Sciscionella sp.]
MPSDDPAGAVQAWLDQLDDRSQELVDAARHVILAGQPVLHELVYHDALGYSTSGAAFDRVLYLAVASRRVTLGFFFGAALDDSTGLLRGQGIRMRSVRLTAPEELRDPAMRSLIQQALAAGPDQVERLHAQRRGL